MNIQQIKSQLSAKLNIDLSTLDMVRQKDEAGNKQEWLSHWDNANRVRVTMHEEIFDKIKADKTFSGLAFKDPEIQPAKYQIIGTDTKRPLNAGEVFDPKKHVLATAAYTRVIIITPTDIEATF